MAATELIADCRIAEFRVFRVSGKLRTPNLNMFTRMQELEARNMKLETRNSAIGNRQ